jgi:hypothetical protein
MRRPCSLAGVAWTSAECDLPAHAPRHITEKKRSDNRLRRSLEGILHLPPSQRAGQHGLRSQQRLRYSRCKEYFISENPHVEEGDAPWAQGRGSEASNEAIRRNRMSPSGTLCPSCREPEGCVLTIGRRPCRPGPGEPQISSESDAVPYLQALGFEGNPGADPRALRAPRRAIEFLKL